MLWACATLHVEPPALLIDAATAALQRQQQQAGTASRGAAQSASACLWACARLQPCGLPPASLAALQRMAGDHVLAMNQQELCSTLWACGQLSCHGHDVHLPTASALLLAVDPALPQLPPRCLAQVASAALHLELLTPNFLDRLTRGVLRSLALFGPQELCVCAAAAGTRSFCNPLLLNGLGNAAAAMVDSFSPPALAQIMWAFGRARHHHGPLTTAVCRAIKPQLQLLDSVSLGNLVWATASLKVQDRQLVERAAKLVGSRLRQRRQQAWEAQQAQQAELKWAGRQAWQRPGADAAGRPATAAASLRGEELERRPLSPQRHSAGWGEGAMGDERQQPGQAPGAPPQSESERAAGSSSDGASSDCSFAASMPPLPMRWPSSSPSSEGMRQVAFLPRPPLRLGASAPSSPASALSSLDSSSFSDGESAGHEPAATAGLQDGGSSGAAGDGSAATARRHARSHTKLLWGFAKAGLYNAQLYGLLAAELVPLLHLLTPHELAMCVWAVAAHGHPCPDLLAAAAPLAQAHAELGFLVPWDCTVVAWAYARLQQPHPGLFAAMRRQFEATGDGCSEAGVARLTWAYLHLGMPGSRELLARLHALRQQQQAEAQAAGRGRGRSAGYGSHHAQQQQQDDQAWLGTRDRVHGGDSGDESD